MGDKIVLGIHSNVDPNANPGLTDGHAWISVTRNGKTQTYGLWPDDHPYIQSQGLDNGSGSDIRTGIEAKAGRTGAENRYYELTPEQFTKLQAELGKNVHWGVTNTCASWASDVATRVTGEKIDASELLGITDTPRALSTTIEDLEKTRKTSEANPLRPDEIQARSSSFSMLDNKVDLENHAVARELRARFSGSVSDERVAQAALLAVDAGIDTPGKIANVAERNGDLHVAGNTPGFRASLGADQPTSDPVTLNRALSDQSARLAATVTPQQEATTLRIG